MPTLKDTLKTWLYRIKDWSEQLAAEKPVKLSLVVAAAFLVIVPVLSLYFWIKNPIEFLNNISVEAHGMVFDLLVISCFLFWLQRRGEKRQGIKRYREEIRDYLPWQEKEATYRIVGLIRRLNDEKVEAINLRGAYLKGARLNRAQLTRAELSEAKLMNAEIEFGCLAWATLLETHLEKAKLRGADLQEANLEGAKLQGATLWGPNSKEPHFGGQTSKGPTLKGPNSKEPHFGGRTSGEPTLKWSSAWKPLS